MLFTPYSYGRIRIRRACGLDERGDAELLAAPIRATRICTVVEICMRSMMNDSCFVDV
jgi:hypothetical protein